MSFTYVYFFSKRYTKKENTSREHGTQNCASDNVPALYAKNGHRDNVRAVARAVQAELSWCILPVSDLISLKKLYREMQQNR